MPSLSKCRIVNVGKRRDGAQRFWCLQHRADATAKYGRRASRCRNFDLRPVSKSEVLKLDVDSFSGGVGVWGAVPPVYDTTSAEIEIGVHVHARQADKSSKEIDWTYRRVDITSSRFVRGGRPLSITEADAVFHMVSTVFGFEVEYIECGFCGLAHLDRDLFSVHLHKAHLCAGCGRIFRAKVKGIGNPTRLVKDAFSDGRHAIAPANREIVFAQADYPGGIQIWASNPAILWTADRAEEEGIHLHMFGANGVLARDETFSKVTIDGVELRPPEVRVLMAQLTLPHIAERIVAISCPKCGTSHFDVGAEAFVPHIQHRCVDCGEIFNHDGRLKKTIANPAVERFADLAKFSRRPRRIHALDRLI